MPLYTFDEKCFAKQIKINPKERQLEWDTRELEDNVFELLALAKKIFSIDLFGNPFQLGEEDSTKFAIKFVDRGMASKIISMSKILDKWERKKDLARIG